MSSGFLLTHCLERDNLSGESNLLSEKRRGLTGHLICMDSHQRGIQLQDIETHIMVPFANVSQNTDI